jgi:hypothetical protein
MSNPSNLYAEKIYAEHPLVLWALDDDADYISLISESQRDITNDWTKTGCTATSNIVGDEPFPDSETTRLAGSVPVGATDDLICISPNLTNFTNLNSDLGTFAVGTYFYSASPYLQSVSIGYEYTDTTTSAVVQKLKVFPTTIFESWAFISETFEIPNENTNLRAVIKITTTTGGVSPLDYRFYINGVTVGQWSEEFNTVSLGVTPESFPLDIALDTTSQVIPAAAYGISTEEGYYLVNDNALVAKNSSVPLVFGASGVTKLLPNTSGEPSLIIPGKGFLNEIGRYKEYTVEFWARINSDAIAPKRIFGPIIGTDGLYVEGGFLTLVIGNTFSSHFVGEWYRPMLIHIRLIRNSATVFINGEEVISMAIDTATLDLPLPEVDSESQDWLGFYAYTDVTPVEIDCVAIYPYQVPTTVAKRRWVYGQGVLSPEGINAAYGGTSAFIDYPFADYTANYNYPDFAEWQQGSFDNLVTTNTAITTPAYQLPEIFLDTKTIQNLYDDCQVIQTGYNESQPPSYKFISFRPNGTWDSEQCYINFPRFNVLNDQVRSVYAVFSTADIEPQSGPVQAQTLLKIYNSLTGDYFIVKQEEDIVKYVLNYNGIDQEIYTTPSLESNQFFAVGLNVQTVSNSFGQNVSSFFGNQNGLKLYVGGDEEAENTFTGKIYTVGLATASNTVDIQDYFDEQGIVLFDDLAESGVTEETTAIALIEHTASYTLLPTEAYDKFFLDIGVSGYWQDYLPLSYFAQFVANDVGNQFYDLDFLQFNIGYPAPSESVENEVVLESWTYGQLKNEYANPSQKTYYQLDNFLFSGWNNYEDMKQKSVKYYEYNTQDASVRSYLTFQYVDEGANLPQSSFTTTVAPTSRRIIDLADYTSFASTKFEVVDNTLIYPTKTIDFNELAIVYHLEFNIRNILTKPIALRRLELASQALSDNSFNPVGTRFGVDMFPYTRAGIYYDYKAKNPFSIYKGSTPYLYLNRKSGIEIRGEFDTDVNRGIAIPINQTNSDNYRISAAQIWMRYDEDFFPGTPTEIFEIRHRADTIKFYMVADSEKGSRARIFARSQLTGQEFNGLSYFWNGSIVREPVITKKEWGVLGIAFSTALNFDSFLGAINLTGPIIFNNIAYYQANNLQQVQSTLFRPWLQIKTDGVTNFDWQYWLNSFTWEGVLVISSSDLYGVSPADVYKTYLGTNKIIIDDEEGMIFDAERLKIYQDTVWQTTVQIPV